MNNSIGNKKALKNVVVAVEPIHSISDKSPNFDIFASMIQKFQKYHLLPTLEIISMIDQAMYTIPSSWYYQRKNQYALKAKQDIELACANKFDFQSIRILKAKSSANSVLIEQLSHYLKKAQSSLLVVMSNNHRSLPYYLLGSFAETAALSASTSVLIIKPQADLTLSTKPRLTVALDPTINYSSKQLTWIANIALLSKAQINLISVKPNVSSHPRDLRKSKKSESTDKTLKKFEQSLIKMGIPTSRSFIKEKTSIAEAIIAFADKTKSWAIITLSVDRKLSQNLLLGSTARKVLALTKRPFLSVRLDKK